MKKSSVIIISTLFATIIIFASTYVWILPMFHNQTLKHFSEKLLNIPLPQKTREIDRLVKIGQQSGNSDHCDYLVAILADTSLTKTEIEKYYSDHYQDKPKISFYWINEPHEPGIGAANSTGIYTLNDWINTKAKITGANVIIYIYSEGMSSALDIRCS